MGCTRSFVAYLIGVCATGPALCQAPAAPAKPVVCDKPRLAVSVVEDPVSVERVQQSGSRLPLTAALEESMRKSNCFEHRPGAAAKLEIFVHTVWTVPKFRETLVSYDISLALAGPGSPARVNGHGLAIVRADGSRPVPPAFGGPPPGTAVVMTMDAAHAAALGEAFEDALAALETR